MTRTEKELVIASLQDNFSKAQATFLVNYRGLTVSQIRSLRESLRKSDAYMKVTKARLMKIAANQFDGLNDLSGQFKDQVGLVFVMGKDVPAVAKQIVDFAEATDALQVVSGFFESKTYSKEMVKSLAALPSKEVLYAQLVGTLQGPIAGLVYTLGVMATRSGAQSQDEAQDKE
jgi:large subunit ribosomal protein L10